LVDPVALFLWGPLASTVGIRNLPLGPAKGAWVVAEGARTVKSERKETEERRWKKEGDWDDQRPAILSIFFLLSSVFSLPPSVFAAALL
jgi:hypothetical protein